MRIMGPRQYFLVNYIFIELADHPLLELLLRAESY
jgi:hypothetical protein